MPEYRYTGKYYSPPDRGSLDGNTEPFSQEFKAESDTEAKVWVQRHKHEHLQIIEDRLVRIVQREVTRLIT